MTKTNQIPDDVRPEYDFASMKGGVRGKYARRARESNVSVGYSSVPEQTR